MPLFKGKQTILADARADGQPVDDTVRPGTYQLGDEGSGQAYSVVWWDPLLLEASTDEGRGLRRDDLISKDASPLDVAADRARYDEWKERRAAVQAQGSVPSMIVTTPTQMTKAETPGPPIDADPRLATADVLIEDARVKSLRPSGKRFGTLVHALLASVPLTATAERGRRVVGAARQAAGRHRTKSRWPRASWSSTC